MMQEYAEWCKQHPDATEEERQQAFDCCIRKLEAWHLLAKMLLAYR